MSSNLGCEISTKRQLEKMHFYLANHRAEYWLLSKDDQLDSFKNEIELSAVPYVLIGRVTTAANIVLIILVLEL